MKIGYSKNIHPKTGVVTLEIYYKNNKRHRDPVEGPALVRRSAKTGEVRCTEYWVDGQLHRDPKDGPARVGIPANDRGVLEQVYMFEGKLHRPTEDGPAWIVTSLKTGIQFETAHLEHGEWRSPIIRYHRETGDLLSITFEEYEDQRSYKGEEEGPDEMLWLYGKCISMRYSGFYGLDRIGGPAQILIDPDTDIITREAYYICSRLSRPIEEGPALIERDRYDGTVTAEEYWVDGKQVHPPARPIKGASGITQPRTKLG